MSEENVDIVRRIYEAAARRDAEGALAFYDPDVEFDSSRSPLTSLIGGRQVFRGHEGLRRFFRERAEALEHIEDVYEELIDAGDEDIIVVATLRGRGRASGIDVERTGYAGLWTIRDGKVVRVVWFATREEALEAAGAARRPARQSNIEVVRAIYEEWKKGNLQAGLEVYDPDMTFIPHPDVPDAGRYVGPEEISGWMRGWLTEWRDFAIVAGEFIEAGDSVVVAARQRGIGKASGIPTASGAGYFQVWTFRGPKVIRIQQFRNRADALESVGLSE